MATFLGVDVSYAQGAINWSLLSQSVSFVIMKSSGGDAGFYTDSHFAANRSGAASTNTYRGFYHFFSNGGFDPASEADYFSSVVNPVDAGTLLILDAEGSGVTVADCKAFLDRVSSNFGGYKPGIYLNQGLVLAHDWSSVVNAGYFLWLAAWTGSPNFGLNSGAWPGYRLHQYSDSGRVSGIGGAVDTDAFTGTSMNDFFAMGLSGTGGGGGGGAPAPPPASVSTPTSQTSTTSFQQASRQAISIPTYNYDKVIFSAEFEYVTSPNAAPAAIDSGTNQAAYPIGIYSTDGGNTWQDLGMGIEAGTFSFLGGSLIPDVFISASVLPNGVIYFLSKVNSGYAYPVLVKIALLATSTPGELTGSTLVQPMAFESVSKLSSYNTYRRIERDATTPSSGPSQTLTAVSHNQPTIPVPYIWHINADGSITHQSNQYDSRGESQSPNPAILLDGSNVYFNNNASTNFQYGYHIYKDNA